MQPVILPRLPKHYGPVKPVKVTSGDHLIMILDELGDELQEQCRGAARDDRLPNGFYHNRSSLVQAFAEGTLFGVVLLQKPVECRDDPFFMRFRNSWPFSDAHYWPGAYYLPCFCVVNQERECEFLWVAKRAQKMGVGSLLVKSCCVQTALCVLKPSEGFWKKNRFELDGQSHGHTFVIMEKVQSPSQSFSKKRSREILGDST